MLRLSVIIVVSISCLSGAGCCRSPLPQPIRPEKVLGWESTEIGSVHILGDLLLKTGESSDNGRIGVKVIEIIEADWCYHPGTFHGTRRARIQFYSLSSGEVLCEDTFLDGYNAVIHCPPEAGISVLSMQAINTEEGWALFDLRR